MFAIEDFSSKTGMTAIARSLSGRRVDHFSLNRARRSAGRRTIHAGSAYRYFYDAALNRSIQEALLDVVNVDLHPAVPWRGTVPGRLPYQRLAFYGAFGIERLAICCLKAVKHTNDRLFDHDPDFNLSLICACHNRRYPRPPLRSTGTTGRVVAQLHPSRAQTSRAQNSFGAVGMRAPYRAVTSLVRCSR